MLNHNQDLFLIVSARLASLQKFLEGKSDAYESLIFIVQRVQQLSSPSRCFHFSTNLDKDLFFAVFCAEMPQQLLGTLLALTAALIHRQQTLLAFYTNKTMQHLQK